MTIPIRTYIPLITFAIRKACAAITKHRTLMQQVVHEVLPAQDAAFASALDAVVAACDVFNAVYSALEGL